MASLLEGSAFITGAGAGIGQATAYSFAQYGITKLAISDHNAESLKATAATLKEKWPAVEVLTLQVDVTSPEQIKTALAELVKAFGRLDIAVNCAGVTHARKQTHEMEEGIWLKHLDVNLNGVFRCQKEELAIMVEQEDLGYRKGRGVIINVASMYGLRGPKNPIVQSGYAAAKHAVVGLTKADCQSYAGSNIRINAVCPGYVNTQMISSNIEELGHPIYEHKVSTPLKRLGNAEEIADTITFLASPLSSYVNGASLLVDGGYCAA